MNWYLGTRPVDNPLLTTLLWDALMWDTIVRNANLK